MENKKLTNDQIVSSVTGVSVEDVLKDKEKHEKVFRAISNLMEESFDSCKNGEDLFCVMTSNISSMLAHFPKELRFLILKSCKDFEEENATERIREAIKKLEK